MVDINLYEKNENYSTNSYRISISKSAYNTNFLKVIYEITYYENFPVFWSASSFYVYIKEKKGNSISFTYYPYFFNDIIDNIEVFFSENHPNNPLIVGLKPKGEEIKYYTFRYLRSIEKLNKFPENINFQIKNLETELITENNIRNKLEFKINEISKNYYTKSDSKLFAPFVEYNYSVDREEFYGPYTLSTDKLLNYKEKNYIENSLLISVKNKSFDFINVYYSDNNIALLVEFLDYPCGTGSCKSFYFKRLSKIENKWKLIENELELINVLNQKKLVLEQIFYLINESIKIYINKNTPNTGYSAKIINNSSDINSQIFKEVEHNITIREDTRLSASKYTCFYHDLSEITSRDENDVYDVSGLRLFVNCYFAKNENSVVNDFEIKLYNNKGTDQKIIYYNPNLDTHGHEHYVYVYFYDNDNVPLLLYQGEHWYKPKSKIEYFDKWIEEAELKDSKPKKINQFLSDNKVLIELKKINRELNEIILDHSTSYGLNLNKKQILSGFETIRIIAIKNEQRVRYGKITHSTKNKGDLGEIKKKGLILEENEKGKSLSDIISRQIKTIFNNLVCYYHISDLNYELPLLLCIGSLDSDNETSSIFYERVDITERSKWKKIDEIKPFQEDQVLTNKINDIYYNFSKSVIIEIEKQGIIGYDFKLVDNLNSGSPSSSGIDSKISVTEKHNLLSNSDYTCFEHSIPLMQLSIDKFHIGGLKFYISSRKILTSLDDNFSKSPIYYKQGKNKVCVYFYHCDSVPLLVSYNNQYYKPKSKNEYLAKWVKMPNIEDPSKQLLTQLDSINAELNEVNIMKITNGSSYGISGEKSGDFSPARINVKACKNNFFRKVTHTTVNKFGVGKILYNGAQIQSIEKRNSFNEVSVYYLNTDIKYTKPLLISLGSVGSFNFERKWYSITGTEENIWSSNTNTHNTFLNIKKKLIVLHSKYLIPLNVILENQSHYNNTFTTPDDTHTGVINIDRLGTNHNFTVPNYRCLSHQLHKYYEENEASIKYEWSLGQSQLNFELRLSLFESKLTLIDHQKRLIPPLKYTQTDCRDKNTITVYFYEPEGPGSSIVDRVPLMFKLKDRFFVPISKETYFHQWQEADVQISDSSFKATLDTVNSMLNEIDLSKINNYGLSLCAKYSFFKKGELSTKRINVSLFSNSKHLIRVHDTFNKFKISKIKPIPKCSFGEISSHLKNKNIVQVAVIFKMGYIRNPELILINEHFSNDNCLTCCYYYRFEQRPKPFEYKFQDVPNGLSLIDKLTKVENYQWNNVEHLTPIIELLKEISRNKLEQKIHNPDYDSTDCRNPSHPVPNDDQCEELAFDESIENPDPKAKDLDPLQPPGTGSSDPSHPVLTWRAVVDYIKEHPEIVYGPGSGVTVAGSAYSLYKLILVFKNK